MYKFIFDVLTDPLGLPLSAIWEYIILLILNGIAYRIAWNETSGGKWGSEKHWLLRIVVFLPLWAATYAIIASIKWLFANWILALFIVGGLVLALVIIIFLLSKKRKRQRKNGIYPRHKP